MQILALLPGVDCCGVGGCVFESCEACAGGIAESGNPAVCPACSSETVDAIAKILGVESVDVKDKTAFIKCAGDAAGRERLALLKTCEDAKEAGFVHGECQWGCIGLGSCTKVCEFDAMKLEDGHVVIDK